MQHESNQVTRTGVIGLGAMGLQMARHMAAKGFDVRGHDIDAAAVGRARDQKLQTASAAEVARHAEVVIVMVATDDQVREVTHELLQQLAAGGVICIASWVARRRPAASSPRWRPSAARACSTRRWCSARRPPTTAR